MTIEETPDDRDSLRKPAGEGGASSERPVGPRTILRKAPAAIGVAWAKAVCAELAREGRAIEGGWPGTIIEARALVSRHLRMQLGGRDVRQPSSEEVAAAVAKTHDSARIAWLAIVRRLKVAPREPA